MRLAYGLEVAAGMRPFGILGATLLAIGAAGCGNEVTFYGHGAGGGGSPPTTGSATLPTSSDEGGDPGYPRTHDGFSMWLDSYDGTGWGCAQYVTELGLYTLDGQVLEASAYGMVIDSCPPDADCMPMVSMLALDAPWIFQTLLPGAFVEVTVLVEIPSECSHELLIRNLPSWGGAPNPVDPASKVYLLAADGVAAAPPNSPITVSSEIAACSSGEEGDDHQLRFSNAQASEDLVIPMGEAGLWELETGQFLLGKNLRSFETGNTDDHGNWAYYLGEVQVEDGT